MDIGTLRLKFYLSNNYKWQNQQLRKKQEKLKKNQIKIYFVNRQKKITNIIIKHLNENIK